MADAKSVTKKIKDEEIKYVDLRFTDPRGKMQHLTMDPREMDEDAFNDGIMFDGSSIAGWKVINESDMKLMPDPNSAVLDPFFAQSTLAVFCDVLEPLTNEPYERDPRGIAGKAEAYLKQTGLGDTAVFGPEAEFFVFDDVRFAAEPFNCGYKIDSIELPTNTDTEYEMGNLGHRPRTKGGYFPVPPIDSAQDLRSEMLSVMADMGVVTEKHHHEVGAAQHELGIKFGPLVKLADSMQIYKYVIHQVAQVYGKTACFMPKPIFGDNGSGMHTHQSIWKDGKPMFAGDKYADLSEMALFYIGGILKHAKALNAYTNPLTNSYKRLVPGYEAPVLLAYSSRNRSASCRIPLGSGPKAKRVEVRFPDPGANPYLAFAALIAAGLHGIEAGLELPPALEGNAYESDAERFPSTLREAIEALEHGTIARAALGDDVVDHYLNYARTEQRLFDEVVTCYERERLFERG
jgi:glutamine synthetase